MGYPLSFLGNGWRWLLLYSRYNQIPIDNIVHEYPRHIYCKHNQHIFFKENSKGNHTGSFFYSGSFPGSLRTLFSLISLPVFPNVIRAADETPTSGPRMLQRALRAMDARLATVWAQRNPLVPLQNPDQALTLASIIEKETGRTSDQPQISAVFNNRLLIGMRLQTDPSVIYGLGAAFDGNLRRADLLADTPFNTYTRTGLPPTPIAMPGRQALYAAVHPAPIKALYFVARGDGTSVFSDTLDAHNRAVNQFQRGK